MPPNARVVVEPGLRKDANEVKLRLKKAGVDLNTVKWDLLNVFYDPTGFDFSCPDYQRLVQDAERSPHLALNFADLAGQDSWRVAGVKSVGYTEIDAFAPVHLDVAIARPGLCRAYLMPASVRFKADAMRQAQLTAAHDSPVYNEIAKRLADCNPPVKLDDHVAKIISIKDTRLDGVNFIARDYKKLIQALKNAKDGAGSPIFAHATLTDPDHWALKASFLATDGTGFREVFRPKLSDRPLAAGGAEEGYTARRMRRYAGQFAENTAVPDLSSLHCAVSIGGCNIHIDETGFVLADESGNPVLDADFLQHLVNELLFKTYAKKILPDGFVDRVNLILPSSYVDYNRVGVSLDLKKTKNYRITLTATCSISGDHDCSGTVTVSGRF
jgi:hypothetical protein